MATRAIVPIFRGQLRSRPANGHIGFIPQIRKLVFEYCDSWSSSANTRTYILNHVEDLARKNPHVEIVVRHRFQRRPIVRGFYGPHPSIQIMESTPSSLTVNNREKVIPLDSFEVNGIEKKVQLLLDASGAQIKPLKRKVVESTAEAVRGIWSGLHDVPFRI